MIKAGVWTERDAQVEERGEAHFTGMSLPGTAGRHSDGGRRRLKRRVFIACTRAEASAWPGSTLEGAL
jgi:hypothetical protein